MSPVVDELNVCPLVPIDVLACVGCCIGENEVTLGHIL